MQMENIDTNQLLDRFQNFCLERDLTLQQIALILKVSHSTVGDILKHKTTRPHPRTLYKIRKFMGEL
jgi:transcriptional regulator with XRE-family HTH domain